MKKIPLLLALILLISSCGNEGKSVESVIAEGALSEIKAKKSELVQKQEELNSKIEKLDVAIQKSDTTQSSTRAALVEIDTLTPQKFKHYIKVQGSISSEENILVSPEIPGIITNLYVDEGDYVRAGQVLATMDASALQSQLNQIKSSYELAKTTYERRKNLWEQNIGSEIQLLQAKSQMESLNSQMEAIQAQIDNNSIVSPISGIVDAVNVKLGEMANPGSNGIRVVNMSKLKALATIAGQYAGNVKKGDSVEIFLPSLNETIQEEISFVSQAIDEQTRSITVEVELGDQYEHLKPNMIVKLKINNYINENATVVPSNVLLRDPDNMDNYYVMGVAKKDGNFIAQRHKVEIGKQYSGDTEILSGLPENPVIISFGFGSVAEGQPIKFNEQL